MWLLNLKIALNLFDQMMNCIWFEIRGHVLIDILRS